MKHIKTFEKYTLKTSNILKSFDYMSTHAEQSELKKYFFEKYPSKVNILNRQGFINPTTLDIVLKFAIKRKDQQLINMINNLKDKFEKIDIEKNTYKYNL